MTLIRAGSIDPADRVRAHGVNSRLNQGPFHRMMVRMPAVLGGVCLVVVLTACGLTDQAGPESRSTPQAKGTAVAHTKPNGAVRTDPEPITRRFAALGKPQAVSWQSGILGDERVPGPSSYWIDAVVTLEPQTARKLRTSGALTPIDAPAVTKTLHGAVPSGPWLGGTDLDRVVSGGGFSARTVIARDADVIVLIAEGSSN